MSKHEKKLIKKSLVFVKRAANRNKHTKRLAQKAKRLALKALVSNDSREIYNLSSFYPTINDYYHQTRDIKKSDPLISILLPTYNTPENFLRECIESIIIQSYPNWELCIADDASPDKRVVEIIQEYAKKDDRIKLEVRETNGHISQATNSALAIATGDFIALMDHDDVLWPNALYEIVTVIRGSNTVDFIYSDEDKIDGSGKVHSYPFLKPDFSPEFLESCNYITHFSCIRTSLIKQIGGLRKGYEGAQDWDLFIRIGEVTTNIIHVSKILYSWRIHEASTASDTDAKPYVYVAQKKLLDDHLERTKRKGVVKTGIIRQHRTIEYAVDADTKASLVIFGSNQEQSKRFLQALSRYPAGIKLQILYVADDGLSDSNWQDLVAQSSVAKMTRATAQGSANKYLAVVNQLTTEYVVFADDTALVASENWALRLIADCQLEAIAIAAPVLLDHTKTTVESAGVGIGYGPTGYANMLAGMPFDDPHYTRGLYAKSRRNVSAVSGALFAAKRSTLSQVVRASTLLEICTELLKQGYRHVYNPYSQIVLEIPTAPVDAPSTPPQTEDLYLNPNFNHQNQRMEVRP